MLLFDCLHMMWKGNNNLYNILSLIKYKEPNKSVNVLKIHEKLTNSSISDSVFCNIKLVQVLQFITLYIKQDREKEVN